MVSSPFLSTPYDSLMFISVLMKFTSSSQFWIALFSNNKWFFHPINNIGLININKPSINWCRISQPSTAFFSNFKAYEVHLRSDFLLIPQLPLSTPRLQGPATRRRRKTWNSASPDAEGRIPWGFWRKMGLESLELPFLKGSEWILDDFNGLLSILYNQCNHQTWIVISWSQEFISKTCWIFLAYSANEWWSFFLKVWDLTPSKWWWKTAKHAGFTMKHCDFAMGLTMKKVIVSLTYGGFNHQENYQQCWCMR